MTTVRQAVDHVKKRWGLSTAELCGVLDVSTSYLNNSIKSGTISLPVALKIEALVAGAINWRDLKPGLAKEVDAAGRRAIAFATKPLKDH